MMSCVTDSVSGISVVCRQIEFKTASVARNELGTSPPRSSAIISRVPARHASESAQLSGQPRSDRMLLHAASGS